MSLEAVQWRLMAASAFGLLSLASPSGAQTVTAATKERTMTSQLQYSIPAQSRPPVEDTSSDATAIRPFHYHAPDAALAELRRRIVATQWPEKETVGDESQGVPLATMRELARHWATDYDWRKCEAQLNALPQFMTQIDGLTSISFMSVRARGRTA